MTTASNGQGKAKTKISKNEAVRRALAHLGKEAGRVQIQSFVKKRFDIVMSLDHISTSRAEALRKKADNEKTNPKPEAAEQPVPGETPTQSIPAQPIAKNEAVRLVVLELGKEATVAQIQARVKERFGHEMTPGHVATERSKALGRKAVKKKAAGKKKPAAQNGAPVETVMVMASKLAPTVTLEPLPSPTTPASNGTGNGLIRLEDLLTLKDLVDRIGVDQLRTLLGVVGGR